MKWLKILKVNVYTNKKGKNIILLVKIDMIALYYKKMLIFMMGDMELLNNFVNTVNEYLWGL